MVNQEPPATEQEAYEQDLANHEWVGECGWCGAEVNIFAHTDCPSNPALPTFKGYTS